MKWLILAWWVSSRFNWINKCILPINWKSIINHNISFLHSLWVKNIWIVLSKKTLETINFIDDSLNINISYFSWIRFISISYRWARFIDIEQYMGEIIINLNIKFIDEINMNVWWMKYWLGQKILCCDDKYKLII